MNSFRIIHRKRQGFTLLELLISIGVIGILSSVVIIAIGPSRAFESVRNAERKMSIRQQERAGTQHQIGTGLLPSQASIPLGGDNALPICRKTITHSDCVNLDSVMPTYIADLPVDRAETSTIITGYRVYTDAQKRMHVCSPYLPAGDVDRCNGIILSSACAENAQYPIPVGALPRSSTLAGTKLYVNNSNGGTVTVINTLTDTVISTITVGAEPYSSTLVGTKLYVNNATGDSVSVIDTLTDTVTSTISVGDRPILSYLIGTKLYVLNYNQQRVSVINTATDTVSGTITIGGNGVFGTVVGTKLYVLTTGVGGTISVINSATDSVTASITLHPGQIISSYNSALVGTKLYVNASGFDGLGNNMKYVYIYETTTNAFIKKLSFSQQPASLIAVGTKVYVLLSFALNQLQMINTTTDTVTATINLPAANNPIYAVAIGTKLYVGNNIGTNITIVNTETNTVVSTANSANESYGSSAVGQKLYINNSGGNSVSVLTASGGTICL